MGRIVSPRILNSTENLDLNEIIIRNPFHMWNVVRMQSKPQCVSVSTAIRHQRFMHFREPRLIGYLRGQVGHSSSQRWMSKRTCDKLKAQSTKHHHPNWSYIFVWIFAIQFSRLHFRLIWHKRQRKNNILRHRKHAKIRTHANLSQRCINYNLASSTERANWRPINYAPFSNVNVVSVVWWFACELIHRNIHSGSRSPITLLRTKCHFNSDWNEWLTVLVLVECRRRRHHRCRRSFNNNNNCEVVDMHDGRISQAWLWPFFVSSFAHSDTRWIWFPWERHAIPLCSPFMNGNNNRNTHVAIRAENALCGVCG